MMSSKLIYIYIYIHIYVYNIYIYVFIKLQPNKTEQLQNINSLTSKCRYLMKIHSLLATISIYDFIQMNDGWY